VPNCCLKARKISVSLFWLCAHWMMTKDRPAPSLFQLLLPNRLLLSHAEVRVRMRWSVVNGDMSNSRVTLASPYTRSAEGRFAVSRCNPSTPADGFLGSKGIL
jgi:hypothetical protein